MGRMITKLCRLDRGKMPMIHDSTAIVDVVLGHGGAIAPHKETASAWVNALQGLHSPHRLGSKRAVTVRGDSRAQVIFVVWVQTPAHWVPRSIESATENDEQSPHVDITPQGVAGYGPGPPTPAAPGCCLGSCARR